jgi:hypothetical protein
MPDLGKFLLESFNKFRPASVVKKVNLQACWLIESKTRLQTPASDFWVIETKNGKRYRVGVHSRGV